MHTQRRFRTVYKKLIVSYIVVICFIIFMVAVISHSYSSRLLKNEMINTGGEVIMRIGETLDRQVFTRVERLWLQCATKNLEVSGAINNPAALKHYDYWKICQQLQNYASENNDIISSIELYIGQKQVLISSKGVGRIKFVQEEPQALSQPFRKIVQKGEAAGGWIPSREDPDLETTGFATNEVLTFYRTIPYVADSGIPFKGYVAVSVKTDAVKNILQPEQRESANFTILDGEGKVLLSSSATEPNEQTVEEIRSMQGRLYYANTEGYIVNAARLSSGSLYLVRMISDNVFFNQVFHMRLMLWSLCILFALVGFGLSMVFARQIYNPILHIVNNIRNFTQLESDQKINEYSIIDGTIHTLSHKVTDLETQVLQNKEALRVKNILSLLSGEESRAVEFDFRYRGFCAAVISFLSVGDDWKEMRQNAVALLEEGVDGADFYVAATFENRIGMIVNYDAEAGARQAKRLLEEISRQKDTGGEAVVAMGGKCSLAGIAASYGDAVKTLQYKFFTEKTFLMADEYLYRELSDVKFSEKNRKAFTSALRTGSEKAVYTAIDTLVEEILESGCSYKQARNRVYEIFSVYFNYVLEENKNPAYGITENTYSQLNRCGSLSAFCEWMKNEIGEFLLEQETHVQIQSSDMIAVAKRIIEENLDKDLSLNFVADRLYIAPSYLSRIFKSETGENFNSYITDRRLELARQLIVQTNDSVNVITQKTGFNSATYLIKRFKEKYGQTPVNYKKNYIVKNSGEHME